MHDIIIVMSGKHISLVYFYLVSAISLVILFFGVYYSVNLALNLTQFEKYPLFYMAEDCEANPFFNPKGPYPADVTPATNPSAEEIKKQIVTCEKRVENERKQQKINDIKNAASFTIAGLFLFLIHFPLARKHSKS